MAGPDDEALCVCPHRLVLLDCEFQRLGAPAVAAFADEPVVADFWEQAGQARDVLVHLAKHGLAAGELVRRAHSEPSSLPGAGGWCTQIPRSSGSEPKTGTRGQPSGWTGVAPPLPNYGLLP